MVFFIFVSNNIETLCETSGSDIKIFKKDSKIVKGELIDVDSNNIVLAIRLPKTSQSTAKYKTKNIPVNLCDSAIIEGQFTGASPYILSSVLGLGSVAIVIGSGDEPNYYVGGAIGVIIGVFSYLFIDNTLTVPEIRLTEIDKYPWKLKPYSRNYRED